MIVSTSTTSHEVAILELLSLAYELADLLPLAHLDPITSGRFRAHVGRAREALSRDDLAGVREALLTAGELLAQVGPQE